MQRNGTFRTLLQLILLVGLASAVRAADRLEVKPPPGGTEAPAARVDAPEVVWVTPPATAQAGIQDGPDGYPPSLAPRDVLYVEPNPAPIDPPVVHIDHCATDAGDCGRAVANACNATGHGAGASSTLAWCDNGVPGQQEGCCTGSCADGATVTCRAG